MALPTHTKYLIIGAGIHGLSTAWRLGELLRHLGYGHAIAHRRGAHAPAPLPRRFALEDLHRGRDIQAA